MVSNVDKQESNENQFYSIIRVKVLLRRGNNQRKQCLVSKVDDEELTSAVIYLVCETLSNFLIIQTPRL